MWKWIVPPVGLVLGCRIYYQQQSGTCQSDRKLDGKTAIVTGASAGIGKETARDLASRGARVILACRNIEKAQLIADEISSSTGNKDVVVRKVDTADLSSVRAFAKETIDNEGALHILVNNTGIFGSTTKQVTSDGLEVTMATNHFGHFLMTNMLLDLLKSSSPSRVVNLSSTAHSMCKEFVPDDLNYESRPFPGNMQCYAQSKLANILFTVELADRLRGTGVTANAVHPGVVATEFFAKEGNWIFNKIMEFNVKLMGKNEKSGAQTSIHVAVADEVENVTGKYFVDCKEETPSMPARNRDMAKKLWEVSERLVKLTKEDLTYKGKPKE